MRALSVGSWVVESATLLGEGLEEVSQGAERLDFGDEWLWWLLLLCWVVRREEKGVNVKVRVGNGKLE